MTPDQIAAVKDPERRAREAQAFIVRGEEALTQVRNLRDSTAAELRRSGWTQRDVATLLGLSPGMVALIDRRQGLGTTRITR